MGTKVSLAAQGSLSRPHGYVWDYPLLVTITAGSLNICCWQTHPCTVPIQSGSPGHAPRRAQVSIHVAPSILSSTTGRAGQEAQKFQNLPPLRTSSLPGHSAWLLPGPHSSLRGDMPLNPFTSRKTEAQGEEVTL